MQKLDGWFSSCASRGQSDEHSLEVGTVQEKCISIQPECLPLYTFSVFRNINIEEEKKASDVFWFIGCFFFLNGSRAFLNDLMKVCIRREDS